MLEAKLPLLIILANIKFWKNWAESSTMKVDDQYIECGATHQFFHQRSIFLNYTKLNEKPVQGATVLR